MKSPLLLAWVAALLVAALMVDSVNNGAATAAGGLDVHPHVTTPGAAVVASGSCPTDVQLVVTGATTGWYDVADVYVDETLHPDATEHWQYQFPMPGTAATVSSRCAASGPFTAVEQIAPVSVALPEVLVSREGDAYVTYVDYVASPERLVGYSSDDRAIPATFTHVSGEMYQFELDPPDLVRDVVLVGFISFGENAEARQITSVAAWRATIPDVVLRNPATVSSSARRLGDAFRVP